MIDQWLSFGSQAFIEKHLCFRFGECRTLNRRRMGNKRIEVVLFIVHRFTYTKLLKLLVQLFNLLPNTLPLTFI